MYGASSETVNPIYLTEAERLGKELAHRGHSLLYGGGSTGLMGAISRGVTSEGGRIISVLPKFMHAYEGINQNVSELVEVDTMAERKEIMENRSDAFLVTPGGIGTLDEFFEILTLVSLDRKKAPIILYNINGFFNNLLNLIDHSIDEGFIRAHIRQLLYVTQDPKAALDFIERTVTK